MTKKLLATIKAEFEYTDATIDDLTLKYSCNTKELKGYTKWKKNPECNNIRLIYETIYTPKIEEHLELTVEEIETEIIATANDIKQHKPVTIDSVPKQARDGFEGLRLLDTKLQAQALTLLTTIDAQLHNIETAKDVRDLVASHTAIRDSYFNTKAPMVNILNGDVINGNKNELAELLDGTADDC